MQQIVLFILHKMFCFVYYLSFSLKSDHFLRFGTFPGSFIRHFASLWRTHFEEDHPLQDLLFAMMRSRGIHILDNFPCFFTTAHSEADFQAIAQAWKEAVLELQEARLLPGGEAPSGREMDAGKPVVQGARLGRDPEGRPAWYVPNPQSPGRYMKVDA